MALSRVPFRLSLLPALKAYGSRSFLAPYSSKVLTNAQNNGTAGETTDDDVEEADQTEILDDDEDLPMRAPPYRVSRSAPRRPWVAAQDERAVKFRMDMPGLGKDEVRVYLDNKSLIIRGKPAEPLKEQVQDDLLGEDENATYHAEILLPKNVNVDQIKSEMKHGVLYVTAPKKVTSISVE